MAIPKFPDVIHEQGRSDIPGTVDIGHWIHKGDIESWPQRPKPLNEATTMEEATHYIGDFKLKQGCNWKKIYGTQGKGKLSFTKQGEIDNGSFLNKSHFEHPTLRDEMLLYSLAAKNDEIVHIFEEIDGNQRVIIGHPDFRADIKVEGDTGDAATSKKGVTVDIEVTDTHPLPRYGGIIQLTPTPAP